MAGSFEFDVETEFDWLAEFEAFWHPKEVNKRMKRGLSQGSRLVAAGIRSEAPIGATRRLRRSVRSRTLRDRPGLGPATVAGVRRRRGARIVAKVSAGLRAADWAPHGGLVEGGHRIVTRSGGFTGRFSRPNPFAVRGYSKTEHAAEVAVERVLEEDI